MKQIEKLHAWVQQSVLPKIRPNESANCGNDRILMFFYAVTETSNIGLETFYLPASHKENEYNIVTFYPVTDEFNFFSTVKAPGEIFCLKFSRKRMTLSAWIDESVLLLGTGKTTCCLYRLLNQFRQFWEIFDDPRIPHASLIKPSLFEPPLVYDDGCYRYH